MGRVPNNDQNFLPDIPTQSGDFAGLRRFLQGARAAIQGYIQNPDAPDMVTGLRVSTDTGGVILRWEPSNRATAYIIYRAFDSNSFSNASAIATIARANNLVFFDPNGQNANATTRYYWVVATNGPVTAPISISVSTPEVAASSGGTTIGDLLKNTTRQRQISPIGALDAAAAPSSTDTVNMKVTIGSAKNWVTGTRATVNSTANGLTAGTNYYLGRFSSTIFAFYLDVQNAVDDVSRVTLTGSISATITPDAVVFCTFPSNAVSALMTTMNEGQGGNWLVRTLGVAPTTSVYSAKLAPGDTTLSTLGWAFSEESPPVGDVCVFHDDPTNVNAGIFSGYAGWNDGTSPLAGPTGPQGARGATWFSGSTVPSGATGLDGDFYLRTSTADVYQKASGVWSIIENILGATGATGAAGSNGATGAYGGAITMDYLYNSTTTNSDPGSGKFRLNSATENTATAIYVNTTSQDSVSLATVLDNLTNSTNINKAMLRIVNKTDTTKFLLFYITGETSHTGYREFAITIIASSASSPFSNSDECLLLVSQIGDVGATGSTGAAGSNGLLGVNQYAPNSNQIYTLSSTTWTDVDASNMKVTFTAPASGKVLVRLTAWSDLGSGDQGGWGLREGSSNIAGIGGVVTRTTSGNICTIAMYITGISAGSHTYKWSFSATSGQVRLLCGPGNNGTTVDATKPFAPAVMEVWAA